MITNLHIYDSFEFEVLSGSVLITARLSRIDVLLYSNDRSTHLQQTRFVSEARRFQYRRVKVCLFLIFLYFTSLLSWCLFRALPYE